MSNIAPSGTLINLWCIIRENRSIFKITIELGNDFDDLRKVIKEERKPRFNDFAPDELVLWKVNVALKEPADTVGNTFQNIVGNNIGVVVDVPITEQPIGIASLTSSIAGLQLQDKQIWVRYNDERVSIKQSSLEDFAIFNVNDLKRTIKAQFDISGNVTIYRESKTLEDSKLVTELHNMEDNAYD
ncbi:hypothetical protein RhiirC2_858490, partial [Rhizophagus irregularis]